MPARGDAESRRPLLGEHLDATPVFPLIHFIRNTIEQSVDAALTEDQVRHTLPSSPATSLTTIKVPCCRY